MKQVVFKSLDDSSKFLLASYTPLAHVSASAIQCYQDCQKKFFDKYVLKEREPGTDATELGSRIHDVLEHYIQDGSIIDDTTTEGRIAAGAIPYIPMPKTEGVGCEVSLDELPLQEPCVLPFKGFIELLDTRNDVVVLTDYKTSSNPKKYGKTPEQLRTNTQMVIYAKHVFDNYDCDRVVLRHIYLQTKGKNYTGLSEVVVSRSEINRIFDNEIRPIIKEMKEASLRKASEQEKNFNFCFSFGAICPSIGTCKNENRKVVLSDEMESLLKALNTPYFDEDEPSVHHDDDSNEST